MNYWSKEADTLNIQSNWDTVPLVLNPNLKSFIDENNIFFILGPKGFGKTLLLKLKSKRYRDNKLVKRFYPQTMLCEKIGTGVTAEVFSSSAVVKFQNVSHWEIIWDLALSITILKELREVLPEEITELIGYANSISDVVNILLHQRGVIYKLQSLLPSYLRPKIRDLRESMALFIDNIDEAFVAHGQLDEHGFGNREKMAIVWRNAQLGFIESAKRIYHLNNHIKIFASIRSEAMESSISDKDFQTLEYCTEIKYTLEESENIFVQNILITPKEHLMFPEESNPLKAFIGLDDFNHEFVWQEELGTEKETFFNYIYRHTLGRPREIVEIGRRIMEIAPNLRTLEKLQAEIQEASLFLLNQYKKEIIPYFNNNLYDLIKSFANTNVFKRTEIQNLSHRKGYDSNVIWNAMQYFYNLGLVGYVRKTNSHLIQRFKTISEFANSKGDSLPNSDYYIFHPAVEEDLKTNNFWFSHNKFTIVGNNYAFHERSKEKIANINIHFGAGRLGLGLVVPIFSNFGKIVVIQRPNKTWEAVDHHYLTLKVNEEIIGDFKYLKRPSSIDQIKKTIEQEMMILIITDDDKIIKFVMGFGTSFSTALGPGLSSVVKFFKTFEPQNGMNIYPFENDHVMVNKFCNRLKQINSNLQVPFVVADRICSNVKISSDEINVSTEEYYEVVINIINGDVKFQFEDVDYNLILARSSDEFRFYYKRKFYLVNGIHMILAIRAYAILLKKHIEFKHWKTYSINLFDDFEEVKCALSNFAILQIARIITGFNWEELKAIFPRFSKKDLFDDLYNYSLEAQNRFSASPDMLSRVFSLRSNKNIKAKFRERVLSMHTFLIENRKDISEFLIEVECTEVTLESLLVEMSELQKIMTELLLEK